MTIEHFYKTGAATVTADVTLLELVKKTVAEGHNSFVVVDAENKVEGVVAMQDLALAIVPASFRENQALAAAMLTPDFLEEQGASIANMKVRDVMRTDFLTATKDTEMMLILSDFLNRDLYCVPVLENGKLVGVFTRTEMGPALLKAMQNA